jgi:hypothetical protein
VKSYFLLSLNGDRHVVLCAIIQVSLDLVGVADTVAAVGLQVEDPFGGNCLENAEGKMTNV